MIIIRNILALSFVINLMFGCAAQQPVERFFWPPAPDEPKVEYIGSYVTSTDLKKKGSSVFSDFLGDAGGLLFSKPWGVVYSKTNGNLYVSDAAQGGLVVLDFARGKSSFRGGVLGAYGMDVDGKGRIFVSSGNTVEVLVYSANGDALFAFGRNLFKRPAGIAINDELGLIYVVDVKDHNVKVFNLAGRHLYSFGSRGGDPGEFNFPTDIAVSTKGDLVITDTLNARVQVFSSKGDFLRTFGERGKGFRFFQFPKGVAIDSEDHIYVTDAMGSHIKIMSLDGDLLLVVGGPYASIVPGGFNLPMGIDIDGDDRIYVVDQQNKALHIFQYMNKAYLEKNPVKLPAAPTAK
ncbi:MAG: 6-bladed beta-propeller [Proteobacteria bacterium]|nr:6-bladed beta-propeller [Pseudomonadota bacterium]